MPSNLPTPHLPEQIPPTDRIRERLDAVDVEARLLRSLLRLAMRRDREVSRLRGEGVDDEA
jgi:hypothetical protein